MSKQSFDHSGSEAPEFPFIEKLKLNMSDTGAQTPGYFDIPLRPQRSIDRSESVSPRTHPALTSSSGDGRSHRRHLLANFRSQSDNIFLHLRPQTQPANKQHTTTSSTPIETTSHELQSSTDDERVLSKVSLPQLVSTPLSERKLDTKDDHVTHTSQPTKHFTGVDIHQKTSQRHPLRPSSWAAGFGGVHEAFYSTRSERRTQISSEIPLTSLQPLRPPSLPTQPSTPQSEHRITVEIPFDDPQVELADKSELKHVPRNRAARGSQMFSATLDTLRRLRYKSDYQTTERPAESSQPTKLFKVTARDHYTSLRKQQTGEGLQRAASMLQELTKLDLKSQISMPTRVSPSNSNVKAGARRTGSDELPRKLERVKSMEMKIQDTESQNSSLVHFDSNPPPVNTPEERAKYTIVNQDGEIEEFLKVDISIRGQTSYLPSEARRIHTPPLPSEGQEGRRRGFFFDYGSPLDAKMADRTATEMYASMKGNRTRQLTPSFNHTCPSSLAVSAKHPIKNSKCVSRARIGDWYDAQFAELNSPSDEDGTASYEDPVGGRLKICSFEATQQRLRDEASLDRTIPEHLPTSPLCPRHPRYWRVIKHKGNQFRGCWMHGFGEFTPGEKARYKIKEKMAVT